MLPDEFAILIKEGERVNAEACVVDINSSDP